MHPFQTFRDYGNSTEVGPLETETPALASSQQQPPVCALMISSWKAVPINLPFPNI